MGKGGPLAFLNKKHFHPGSIRNVEEVWKREQKAAKEEAKKEELHKQIAQERQLEELNQVAEKAGHARPQDRLDWMYGCGMGDRTEAQRKKDEADAMSKPAVLEDTKDTTSRIQQISTLPSFYVDDTPQSANEAWSRLNNDPLMMIKRQEQEAIKRIRKNPVQMERIKKEVKKLKEIKKEKKRRKKELRALQKEQSRSTKGEASSPGNGSNLKRRRHKRSESPVSQSRKKDGYGLKVSSFHAEDRTTLRNRADETRRRIRDAEERNAVKRQKEGERYQRRTHCVGRLTAEEQAERLSQMTQDATTRHQRATARIAAAERRDQAELDAMKTSLRRMDSGGGAEQEIAVAVAGWVTKSDRKIHESVSSRKYYSQHRRETRFGR